VAHAIRGVVAADSGDIARDRRPRWLRGALVGVAVLYYAALVVHPPNTGWSRPLAFFTSATCLFPRSSAYSIDYRLAAWSCTDARWQPFDHRPLFPIQADDKESRFQRLAYFYKNNRTVMRALDSYVAARHGSDGGDGVAGPIGGIRLLEVLRPLPAPGEPFKRYTFDPLAPLSRAEDHRDGFSTPGDERKQRCGRAP